MQKSTTNNAFDIGVFSKEADGDGKIKQILQQMQTLRTISDRYEMDDITDKVSVRMRDAALPVFVVIAGEGNYGKSSLLNALAGKDIAPVSIIPLTWKVDVYRLSNSNTEYAQVRFTGDEDYKEISIKKAQSLCAKEEERIKNNASAKPNIHEVIWHFKGLQTGPEICLVDTPGLEQAGLGVDITSERLVKGLGATYTVDEVWHYYYYRADVVLWTFESTKLDSKGTYETIDRLVKLQKKQIVPVATKADKVPKNRWIEIARRFKNTYQKYFTQGLERTLFCTVCGGKSDLVGEGVKELRQYISDEIASKALAKKKKASEDFRKDTSRELSNVLYLGAKQLTENLRTMADAADEVALNLIRMGAERRDQIYRRINTYMQQKIEGLHGFLYPAVERAIQYKNISSIKSSLGSYVGAEYIENILDTQIKEISSQLQSLAVALCRQRRLHRVNIGSSGRQSREQFSFLIDIKDPHIPPIRLSGISYRLPTINLVDDVVRGIKNLLGLQFKMTIDENQAYVAYSKEVIERLNEIPSEARKIFLEQISSRVAPALLKAVTVSLNTTTKSSAASIVSLLQQVDLDIRQLYLFSEDKSAMPNQFGNWAKYWMAETRDVELAKELLMDVLWPLLPNMQSYTKTYNRLRGGKREFLQRIKAAYKKTRKTNEVPIDNHKQGATGFYRAITRLWNVLSCAAKPANVTASTELSTILSADTNDKVTAQIIATFEQFLHQDPVIKSVEQRMAEVLPDATLVGFARPYADVLASHLSGALPKMKFPEIKVSVPALAAFKCSFSRYLGPAPFVFLTISPIVGVAAKLAGMTLTHAAYALGACFGFGILLMIASNLILGKTLKRRIEKESLQVANRWIAEASSAVAGKIDEVFLKELIDRITLLLHPRPLQRVTSGELRYDR